VVQHFIVLVEEGVVLQQPSVGARGGHLRSHDANIEQVQYPKKELDLFFLPYPKRSSSQTKSLLNTVVLAMIHLTMTWRTPKGLLKAQLRKQLEQSSPRSVQNLIHLSGWRNHFSEPGLFENVDPSMLRSS
jgi:hypothetical protein